MYRNTNENGITLVALIVTIIVLLILTGITINYVANNGIIDKAKLAMDYYENADKNEQNILGDFNKKIEEEMGNGPVYNEEGAEDNIAPADLFEYEIINDGSIASTYMQNLPTKTARITGFYPQYINGYDEEQEEIIDSNYKIEHEGINDILIIPYQVRLDKDGKLVKDGGTTQDSEMYKITEVNLSIYGTCSEGDGYQRFPNIRKIVYPNTVEKIIYSDSAASYRTGNEFINYLFEIVLSSNIDTIDNYEFSYLDFPAIDIPNSVTNIGVGAFYECRNLKKVKMSENVKYIGEEVFRECRDLTEITIPKNLTDISNGTFKYSGLSKVNIESELNTIGEYSFAGCDGIKEIVIPGNIKNIGQNAFQNWGEDQTIYFECSESNEKNWNRNWDYKCNANIVWDYNPNEATE